MDFLSFAVNVTFIALCISLVLAFYRVVVGPSLPDRVVAIDLIAYLVIGFIATYCIASDQPVYLDAAIVLALIAFLGTIAFARYIGHPKVEGKN
ncbi:MAG: cation:proton antiporter [Balneolales bacterium]